MRMQIAVVGLLAIAFSPFTMAAEGKSLDDLLESVRSHEAKQEAIFQERTQEFLEAKEEREDRLTEIRRELEDANQRTTELKDTFEANKDRLDKLEATLSKKSGDLKEVFGAVREEAGTLKSKIGDSLVSAQYPGRKAFLDKLNGSDKQPSMDQLRQLWFEMFRQLTASSEVVSFDAPVITADGKREQRRVIRVGTFNAVSSGKYLDYDAEVSTLVELPSQPAGRYLNAAEALSKADSGIVPFAIDPTGGQLLSMLIQRPDLSERVQQGGTVGYIILSIGVLGLLIALERLGVLAFIGRKMNRQIEDPGNPRQDNPLGRVLAHYDHNRAEDTETLELKMDESVLKESPLLQRRIPLIKLLASVAPLLGLLGTVTGMIETFQDITLFGTGDPKLMAGGISKALVTTALGLTVAVPLIFLHSLVSGRSKNLVSVLEEQSAGLIAEHAESEAQRQSRS